MLRSALSVSAAAIGVVLLCVSALHWLGYDLFVWALSVQ
jgi:hypothetical protein